jgi:hypothetical protein
VVAHALRPNSGGTRQSTPRPLGSATPPLLVNGWHPEFSPAVKLVHFRSGSNTMSSSCELLHCEARRPGRF